MDPEAMQRFAAMREAMNELNQGAEQNLARILDPRQYTRLKQIQLQLEGPSALARPDMVEKLNLDDAQVEQIQGLIEEHRQAQREGFRARGELMKSAMPNLPAPNPGNNGQNGGNRGNRARFNDPAFQEAMKKFWESPETKAKMEEFRNQDEKLNNLFAAAVNRVLTKRQSAAYKKMLGAPFDRSKLGGPGGFPWNRRGNANGPGTSRTGTNNPSSSTAKSESGFIDEVGTTSTKSSASTKSGPGDSPAPARSKRKSLRERRGIPDKSE
jgi:hypothetical protein